MIIILRYILGVIGLIVTLLLPLLPFLSEADTCTMGAADGYAVSSLLSIAILFMAFPLVVQLYFLPSWLSLFGLVHLVTLAVYTFKVVPLFWLTTILGAHICDLSYGDADIEQRLYAPILLVTVCFIISPSMIRLRNLICSKGIDKSDIA
ncbi:hypothetical protein EHO60_13240 [Leptospira fletcheri]|uniref:Uncharacterized protein n=1 Tax=Leptospira fletcheri TaxID=2484981 RepID=A0A4R9GB37_9LEPT|nr:hypothetical protein [Leptospira fletcheri]TGK08986.1 hypothetical protein EHO60_13240 [Leptospira fletcheri]